GLSAPHDRDQEEDHGAERGQALRHRGSRGAAGARRDPGRTGGRSRRRVGMTPVVRERVFHALAEVYDPELDEPITSLGFVASCEIGPDGEVEVALRLPTPQCAPNFAFLMAADARRVVRGVPGVRDVTVRLTDHYTGEEINAALDRGVGFTGAFPGETADDDLEALRLLFTRKALVARQSSVCEELIAAGASTRQICGPRLWERPHPPAARPAVGLAS